MESPDCGNHEDSEDLEINTSGKYRLFLFLNSSKAAFGKTVLRCSVEYSSIKSTTLGCRSVLSAVRRPPSIPDYHPAIFPETSPNKMESPDCGNNEDLEINTPGKVNHTFTRFISVNGWLSAVKQRLGKHCCGVPFSSSPLNSQRSAADLFYQLFAGRLLFLVITRHLSRDPE
ncbi:hypothetical protein CEXT_57271 [Caerostris extrusa]|uniref:Uncharacterized protein n=1 Tax=Caerostris extrusa TaxID=172846 RepID=A0AAV4MED2_CAEEX|nr:hypothetical protein CEXT_57271 [Caerostris extrusa]